MDDFPIYISNPDFPSWKPGLYSHLPIMYSHLYVPQAHQTQDISMWTLYLPFFPTSNPPPVVSYTFANTISHQLLKPETRKSPYSPCSRDSLLATKIYVLLHHIPLALYKWSYDKFLSYEMRTKVMEATFGSGP